MRFIWQPVSDNKEESINEKFYHSSCCRIGFGIFGKINSKKEKEIEVTEGKFLIKLPSGFFWLGLIEAGIVCIAMVMMKSENDLSIELTIVCILVMLPGVMLMIGPLPGV